LKLNGWQRIWVIISIILFGGYIVISVENIPQYRDSSIYKEWAKELCNYAIKYDSSVERRYIDKNAFKRFNEPKKYYPPKMVDVTTGDLMAKYGGDDPLFRNEKKFTKNFILEKSILPEYQTKIFTSLNDKYINKIETQKKTYRMNLFFYYLAFLGSWILTITGIYFCGWLANKVFVWVTAGFKQDTNNVSNKKSYRLNLPKSSSKKNLLK